MKTTRRTAIGLGIVVAGLARSPGSALAAPAQRAAAIVEPRVCGLVDPLALGDLAPHFSWRLRDPGRDVRQTAYRLRVARTADDLAGRRNLLWDSGRIASTDSLSVEYGGPRLVARDRAIWDVEVWSDKRRGPLRSAAAIWETGLIEPADWSGQWLASETLVAKADREAGMHWIAGAERPAVGQLRHFRWTFDSSRAAAAELALSANETQGVWLNGQPVSAPQDGPVHWTEMASYPLALRKGRNVIAVAVKRLTGFGVAPPALAGLLREGTGLTDRRGSYSPGWKVALAAPVGWEKSNFDDAAWASAVPATGTLPVGEPWPAYPANHLRRQFSARGPVRSARLYATALGVYEPWLNGAPIGDQKLAPEFTDPSKRVLYQAYDVTDRIVAGMNTLGFAVGDGWYGGKYSSSGRFSFGPAPCRLLAQLELTYDDGSRETVATGDGWQIAESAIRANSLYDGEVHDARLERADWSRPDGDRNGWRDADRADAPKIAVDPQRCAPIRANEVLRPVAVRRLGAGRFVADFGQNFAGWPRLGLTAPAGTRVTMRFAEILKPSGEVDQANLRTAWQRDVYIAAGRGRETWEPRFTYHGFRYVELAGLPDDPAAWSLEGLVGYQDLDLTGEFRVGDPVIAKFWQNSLWSQKSNFFGLPTDCPQRDERLGWMGDAEVFWPAAAFNMDIAAYTARVMDDMRRSQSAKGAFPDVIPPFVPGMNLSSPGWADAGVVLPYTAWRQYGDTGVVKANWAAMAAYLDWIQSNNPDHLWKKNRGADYGDWLSVDANPANPGDATTPKDLIGTAFWAENARMMAEMAAATGNPAAEANYRQLFGTIRDAFTAAYVKPDGTVGNASQTSYVLAIRFGLLEPAATAEAGRRLAADIARRGNHLSTGFLGTPHILDALDRAGQADTAISLLLQRSYPSWGYMVEQGATTMWERWNSDAGDTGMNSRNHYAFGAIGAFLFRRIAGIEALEPGFARIRVAPLMDPRLRSGGATYRSARGPIRTDWAAKDGAYRLDLELPAGVEAEVRLPDQSGKPGPKRAGPGLHRYSGKLA